MNNYTSEKANINLRHVDNRNAWSSYYDGNKLRPWEWLSDICQVWWNRVFIS